MKKLFFPILVFSATAFTVPAGNEFSAKAISKEYSKIKENIYLNKYEVSNVAYRDFLSAIQLSDPEKYISCLPDTTVWHSLISYNDPFSAYYFRHPAYDNYPVVGVSFESANAYCQWLTESYNADEKRKFNKVVFRLPSIEEWQLAANGGDDGKQYPWGSGYIKNNRNMQLCNYKNDAELIYNPDTKKYYTAATPAEPGHIKTIVTSPVKSFYPSSFGMYNMSGNVAEMVAYKGIAMGGGFNDAAWDVTVKSEKRYNGPSADIGFRVLMEVIEK